MNDTMAVCADEREAELRVEYNAFCDALAGTAPLHLRLSSDGQAFCADFGVWARVMRPHWRAPATMTPVAALMMAANKFLCRAVAVHADARTFELLTHTLAVHQGACATRDSLPVSPSTLRALDRLTAKVAVTVDADPTVDFAAPVGLVATNVRFGRRAEGAYHDLCSREGLTLLSVDGAAYTEPVPAWGWAWWRDPDRWAAGGGPGGSSQHAEMTAVCEALDAHPGMDLAVMSDLSSVGRIVAAAGGRLIGAVSVHGAAGELLERVRAHRGRLVWLPVSSGSSSSRHTKVDRLARQARIVAADSGPGRWSPQAPLPAGT